VSDAFFRSLAKRAAGRYPAHDRYARHFAFGKLTGDPAFGHLIAKECIPSGARLLDLGCGQGLVAALLAAAEETRASGEWPPGPPAPPAGVRVTGIELMAREVERARAATPAATFIQGDIASAQFPASDMVLILDVLHYLAPAAQSDVLQRVRHALAPRGTLLLRVADAAPTLRFRYTLLVDRVASALRGLGWVGQHCRPVASWREELEGLGFVVEALPMSAGTPFANVLLAARYDAPGRRDQNH